MNLVVLLLRGREIPYKKEAVNRDKFPIMLSLDGTELQKSFSLRRIMIVRLTLGALGALFLN